VPSAARRRESKGQVAESPKAFWIAQLRQHHRDMVAAREYLSGPTLDEHSCEPPYWWPNDPWWPLSHRQQSSHGPPRSKASQRVPMVTLAVTG
jgi:hypothetical protein